MTKPRYDEHDTVFARAYQEVDGAIYRVVDRVAEGASPTPEHNLRAALAIQQHAGMRVVRYAEEMRGHGATWDQVAEVLGYVAEEDPRVVEGVSPAERAFYLVAPESQRGMMYEPSRTRWTCGGPGGCGERITDTGPFESDPDNNERGHAETCVRHAAAVATWKRERRW